MFSGNPILSRSMAIALLVAVLAGVWSGVAAPVLDQRRVQKAEIEQTQRLIQGFEARREDTGALKRRLDALRTDPATAGAYFTARNQTLAAAKLQSRIKALTEAAGARLTSTQVLTEEGAKGRKESERITVRVTMVGSIEAVRGVFHTLESGRPFVFLDDVAITAQPIRRRARLPNAGTESNGLLTVRYSAYGFLWNGKTT